MRAGHLVAVFAWHYGADNGHCRCERGDGSPQNEKQLVRVHTYGGSYRYSLSQHMRCGSGRDRRSAQTSPLQADLCRNPRRPIGYGSVIGFGFRLLNNSGAVVSNADTPFPDPSQALLMWVLRKQRSRGGRMAS
jgi:hypothetical protein